MVAAKILIPGATTSGYENIPYMREIWTLLKDNLNDINNQIFLTEKWLDFSYSELEKLAKISLNSWLQPLYPNRLGADLMLGSFEEGGRVNI